MSVSKTSLTAFNKLIETKKLSKRRRDVAEALFKCDKPMTSAMLERESNIPRCTVTGRFAELEKDNVIRVVKTGTCEVTGSSAKFYTVIENL